MMLLCVCQAAETRIMGQFTSKFTCWLVCHSKCLPSWGDGRSKLQQKSHSGMLCYVSYFECCVGCAVSDCNCCMLVCVSVCVLSTLFVLLIIQSLILMQSDFKLLTFCHCWPCFVTKQLFLQLTTCTELWPSVWEPSTFPCLWAEWRTVVVWGGMCMKHDQWWRRWHHAVQSREWWDVCGVKLKDKYFVWDWNKSWEHEM